MTLTSLYTCTDPAALHRLPDGAFAEQRWTALHLTQDRPHVTNTLCACIQEPGLTLCTVLAIWGLAEGGPWRHGQQLTCKEQMQCNGTHTTYKGNNGLLKH